MRTKQKNYRLRIIPLAFIVLLVMTVGACDDFAVSDLFYRETGLPLAIYPAAAAVGSGGSVAFTGTGGAPDYEYRLPEGSAGSIDPDTGVYTAPSFAGEFTVEVVDKSGDVSLGAVYVVEQTALRITPTFATVLTGQQETFDAYGGTGSYEFTLPDGETVGTIDIDTGVFTADSAETGQTTVTVTDGAVSTSATVYVYDQAELMLTPTKNPIVQLETTDLIVTGESGEISLSVDPIGAGTVSPATRRFEASETIGVVTVTLTDQSANPPYDLEITVLPAPPGNFTANGATGNPKSIELTWTYETAGIAGFTIERRNASSASNPWGPVSDPPPILVASTRTYVDTNLSPNTPYEYRIVAVSTGTPVNSPYAGPVYSVSNP